MLSPHESPKSIRGYLIWLCQQVLVEQGGPAFAAFKHNLGEPAAIQILPSDQKDVQYPAEAVNADEGTYDGNAQVITSLLDQLNTSAEELEHSLRLFHGDLGTLERIEGLKKMRTIEESAQNRLDFLLYVPGLFHMKMAAADAYARIHVFPVKNRAEKLGVNEYLNHLRPKATAEFTSKNGPSFRSMHDAIHHVVWTDILQCFAREVKNQFDLDTFAAFAESRHGSWENIVKLSEQVVSKYLPDVQFQERVHKPISQRDFVFENLAIRNRDGLLYLGFSRAISFGDVGRIIQLFPYLISTFAAVGKHKYATQMSKFLTDLNRRYPPALRNAILGNWLFNTKGTPDGFRPFDWVQELNNLYTKARSNSTQLIKD
ncbi:hypothetical protein F5878DRAFT_530951 [Lentinula raphanica]|uniref:DUF6589 domain-containing protein n=1 Tax=Lentinula raphanica TaxID=153919 RepID=A0AA38PF49_9AGAR|nr:hypothetical protein F5880DRAFT_1472126 [Lentinula raphanica]KAJ3841790.1 hypothetical protein F5878DRAFT_530951 [Lentinula raphanica]